MWTCNRLDLQTLGSEPVMPKNLPDHWCWILKSSTPIKCHHFGRQISILCSTEMCSAKFSPFTMKASPKTAYHKMWWLQFTNKNMIARLYSWDSIMHFHILTTPTISTMQLPLGTDCNFSLASTTICESGFSKNIWVKSDCRSRLKLETLDTLVQVSLCGLPIEHMDWDGTFWHLEIDQKPYCFAFGWRWRWSALCTES